MESQIENMKTAQVEQCYVSDSLNHLIFNLMAATNKIMEMKKKKTSNIKIDYKKSEKSEQNNVDNNPGDLKPFGKEAD